MGDQVTVQLSESMKGYSEQDYKAFGKHVGKLIQELIMLVVPEEYSLDEMGHLQRKLGLDHEELQSSDLRLSAGLVVFLITLVAGLMAFTSRYHRRVLHRSCSAQHCAHPAQDVEILELPGDDEYVE